jgi:hypothetical protein
MRLISRKMGTTPTKTLLKNAILPSPSLIELPKYVGEMFSIYCTPRPPFSPAADVRALSSLFKNYHAFRFLSFYAFLTIFSFLEHPLATLSYFSTFLALFYVPCFY